MKGIASLRSGLKALMPWRKKHVIFAGQRLTLDMNWRHERKYLHYIERGVVNGPIAMDAWVFSHFVKRGAVVLDAGANIGFTSLLAKGFGASEIHSFEPDPRLIARLRSHCHGDAFQVYEMALGDRRQRLSLCLSATHNQGSSLSDAIVSRYPKLFRGADSVSVDVGSVDELFANKHFDLLKIDVEGAELAMLKGAAALLQSNPPGLIYIEVYPDFFDQVHACLKPSHAFGYRVICDARGYGCLYGLEFDVGKLDPDQYFTVPPSYLFSSGPLDAYTESWTAPLAMPD